MRCRPRTGDFYTIKGLLVFSCVSHFWKLFGPSGRRARRVGSRDGLPRLWLLTARGWKTVAINASKLVRGSVSATFTLEVYTATRRSPVAGRRSPVADRRSPVRRLAGVPICCVERWNLIRRLATRRYAASPVCQSVVLNVGIWYGDSPVAGTPIRRCTNLLCWTLESDTATRRSPVRRFAGVPICYVGRWNLIRRRMVIDSPVYADSPVYQSVVLNVGIWYGDSPVAGRRSPVRCFAGVPICYVGRWNLIRRMMVIDSPVYADSPVYQSVVLDVGIWYAEWW